MERFPAKRNSKLGIISFIFSILCLAASGLMFVFLISNGKISADAAFISFFISCISSIIAFLLGFAVFFQKKTKRIFGIIGFFLGLAEVTLTGLSIFLLLKLFENLGKALGSGFGKM